MALLTFDTQKDPKKAYASMAVVLAVMLVFPFAAAPFGNSWVRIAERRGREREDHQRGQQQRHADVGLFWILDRKSVV